MGASGWSLRKAEREGVVHGRSLATLVDQCVASALVTAAEADAILAAQAAQQAAIQVDDFSPQEHRPGTTVEPSEEELLLRAQA